MACQRNSHNACRTENCHASDNGHNSRRCVDHRDGAATTTEAPSLIAFRARKAARLAAKAAR